MPLALTMAIAPVLAALGTLTMGCTHQTIHVELHQPLRDETNHLAQQILVGPLLKQLRQCHPFIGHRFPLRFVEASQLQPYRKNRWPPQGGRSTSNFYTTPRDTASRPAAVRVGSAHIATTPAWRTTIAHLEADTPVGVAAPEQLRSDKRTAAAPLQVVQSRAERHELNRTFRSSTC